MKLNNTYPNRHLVAGLLLWVATSAVMAQTSPAGATLSGLSNSTDGGIVVLENPAGASAAVAGTDLSARETKSPGASFAYLGLFDPYRFILDQPVDWLFVDFEQPENPSRFLLGENAYVPPQQPGITLNEMTPTAMGIAMLNRSVPVGEQQEFNVRFTVELNSGDVLPADGVAVFLTAEPYSVGPRGGWIGHNPAFGPALSVEIDVFQNVPELHGAAFNDPPSQHVGINLGGSPISAAIAAAPAPLQNRAWQVWVEYSGTRELVSVYLAPTGHEKPAAPLLRHRIDLVDYLGSENFFVTFVGTTGDLAQTQRLAIVEINNRNVDRNSVRVEWLRY